MSVKSVRLLLSNILFTLVFMVGVQTASAQVIVSTSTPTMTPTPTVAVATATPTVATALNSTTLATPTPIAPVTGPKETFAILGMGSIALVVVGLTFFFLF